MISRSDRQKMQDFVSKTTAKKPAVKAGPNPMSDDKPRAQKMSPRGNKNQPIRK